MGKLVKFVSGGVGVLFIAGVLVNLYQYKRICELEREVGQLTGYNEELTDVLVDTKISLAHISDELLEVRHK